MVRASQLAWWVVGFLGLMSVVFVAAKLLIWVQTGALYTILADSTLIHYASELRLDYVDSLVLLLAMILAVMNAVYRSVVLVHEGRFMTRTMRRNLRNERWWWTIAFVFTTVLFVYSLQA